MTNQQLYLAIGIPIVFNFIIVLGLYTVLSKRLDDLKDLWRAELRRIEEVIDARLKHLEEILKVR